jgi:hypothetical protein
MGLFDKIFGKGDRNNSKAMEMTDEHALEEAFNKATSDLQAQGIYMHVNGLRIDSMDDMDAHLMNTLRKEAEAGDAKAKIALEKMKKLKGQ